MPDRTEHIPLLPIIPSILDADFSAPLIISLVGGGGKTSTAFWLAQEFKKRGHCVLVSKTNYQNPLSLFAIKMKQRRIMEK